MGGTSFDARLIVDGAAEVSTEAELEGLPDPDADASTSTSIGAGGGCSPGSRRAACASARRAPGAIPGPACYGRGGTEPTVTDANLLLGRITRDGFARRRDALDRDAATTAVDRSPASSASTTLGSPRASLADRQRAAWPTRSATITVTRGIDPRDFDLLAFGGAGPMHAVALAEELEIARRHRARWSPGTLSAWGMLQTYDPPRLRARVLPRPGDARAAPICAASRRAARGGPSRAARRRHRRRAPCAATLGADLRYRGQEYTLNVPLPRRRRPAELARRFTDAHHARYGHSTRASARVREPPPRRARPDRGDPAARRAARSAERRRPSPDAVVEAVFDGAALDDAALHARPRSAPAARSRARAS